MIATKRQRMRAAAKVAAMLHDAAKMLREQDECSTLASAQDECPTLARAVELAAAVVVTARRVHYYGAVVSAATKRKLGATLDALDGLAADDGDDIA